MPVRYLLNALEYKGLLAKEEQIKISRGNNSRIAELKVKGAISVEEYDGYHEQRIHYSPIWKYL